MVHGLLLHSQPGEAAGTPPGATAGTESAPATATSAQPVAGASASPTTSLAGLVPTAAPTALVRRVGIVAGHWGHDPGAVCPDGLTEMEINLDVAERVVHVLQAKGYQVDLLEEHDARLTGYVADALISIHADSCVEFVDATPPASGFKVASVDVSDVPQAEARLVTCLTQHYAARTELYFHANSITYDMTRYHVFSEIAGETPGAIIETGFMYLDRDMLTQRADLVAQGIVDGIVCFLEQEQ
jgi:N-acetylmuramoyl-L-alanine amidase